MAKLTGIKQSDISSKKERQEILENNNLRNHNTDYSNDGTNTSNFVENDSNIPKNNNKNLEDIAGDKEDTVKNKATKKIENKNKDNI